MHQLLDDADAFVNARDFQIGHEMTVVADDPVRFHHPVAELGEHVRGVGAV